MVVYFKYSNKYYHKKSARANTHVAFFNTIVVLTCFWQLYSGDRRMNFESIVKFDDLIRKWITGYWLVGGSI